MKGVERKKGGEREGKRRKLIWEIRRAEVGGKKIKNWEKNNGNK